MPETGLDVSTWALVVASVALALALPFVAARRFTPALLREAYVLSRPGVVITMLVVALVLLSTQALLFGLLALAHPFLWSTTASMVSGIVVVAMYWSRYRSAARTYDGGPVEEEEP
jgi:hypothetical protein